jgi:hypothetical protein
MLIESLPLCLGPTCGISLRGCIGHAVYAPQLCDLGLEAVHHIYEPVAVKGNVSQLALKRTTHRPPLWLVCRAYEV